jgi:hypothetical protein
LAIDESKKALDALGGHIFGLATIDWKKVARELAELSPEERNEILMRAASAAIKLFGNLAQYRGIVLFLIKLLIK